MGVLLTLIAALAAWSPGDPEFLAPDGIGSYAELSAAIDLVDAEARGWMSGLEHRTGFTERKLEAAACKLWCFSAIPDPLDDVPVFGLSAAGRWDKVVERYRKRVDDAKREGRPFDVFIRQNLRATARAGGGTRTEQARYVLNWWLLQAGGDSLSVRRESPVSYSMIRLRPLPSARRRALHRLYGAWFRRVERQLTWDPERRQFTAPGGDRLPDAMPPGRLDTIVAEEEKNDDAADDEPAHPPGVTDGLPVIATDPPPIVYNTYGKPAPLDADQTVTVHRLATALQPKERPIWFIYVVSNSNDGEARHFDAVAYYVPDQSGRRARRGRSARIHFGESLSRYAQVGEPREVYGEADAGAPPVPKIRARPSSVPFRVSNKANLDDASLVELIDAVRKSLANVSGDKQADRLPVLSVEMEDDQFRVRTGRWSGVLSGHGYDLWMVLEGDTFRLVRMTLWMS